MSCLLDWRLSHPAKPLDPGLIADTGPRVDGDTGERRFDRGRVPLSEFGVFAFGR